jgi:hypothetical protein
MLIGVATYGVLELSFANSHWYALSVILMGLVGICHIAANALIQTIVQGNAAPEMRSIAAAACNRCSADLKLENIGLLLLTDWALAGGERPDSHACSSSGDRYQACGHGKSK